MNFKKRKIQKQTFVIDYKLVLFITFSRNNPTEKKMPFQFSRLATELQNFNSTSMLTDSESKNRLLICYKIVKFWFI